MLHLKQLSFVLAVALQLVMNSSALAQPTFSTVESIDWMVTDSQFIVRGTIDSVEYEAVHDSEREVWATVSLKVVDTFKGQHSPIATFMVRRRADSKDLDEFCQQRREILVFLIDRENQRGKLASLRGYDPLPTQCEWTPRFFQYGTPAIFGFVETTRSALITTDLQVLTEPNTVAFLIREGIKATSQATSPSKSHVVQLYLRSHMAWSHPKALLPATNISLIVPVDSRLEKQAHKWSESEDPYLRREAAKALAAFPSKENKSLLRRLLDDPFYARDARQDHIMVEGELTTRLIELSRDYIVRKAAWESLRDIMLKTRRPEGRP